MTSAAVSADGLKLVISYSEPLTGTPETADFAITGLESVTVSSAAIGMGTDTNKVFLTLSAAISSGVSLSNLIYTAEAGTEVNSIKDVATPANNAATQTLATITNDSTVGVGMPVRTINGTSGDDNLTGTSGDDSITGGSGDDFISGGLGDDTIDGGENSQWGRDIVSYHNSPSAVSVMLGTGAGSVTGGEGNDVLYQIEGVEGSNFNDTLIGSTGSDDIQGGEGSDLINGGSGDDFITGGQGSDTIDGGADYDMISYRNFDHQNPSGTPNVVVDVNLTTGIATDNWGNTDTLLSIEAVEGSDFNDSIVGSSSDEFLFGSQGNDTILGGGGSDDLQGGEGSDSITGGSGDDFISGDQGNDILIGGGGLDHIHGGEGSDSITGGSGDDFISGGSGIDTLTGGTGHDTFIFNLGSQSIPSSTVTDVISDFVHGEDIIDFGIPSSGIQFVSNTVTVSDIATFLSAVTSKNNEESNKTDGKVLCYFGVVGTEAVTDGYLVTEDDFGVMSNIIQLTGVTSFTISDFVSLQTTLTPIVTQQPTLQN
jgi:Ca2+-binding RTX toxin-like protein